MTTPALPIEAKDIQKLIPHRYPFMLIDRITAFESGKALTAVAVLRIGKTQFRLLGIDHHALALHISRSGTTVCRCLRKRGRKK